MLCLAAYFDIHLSILTDFVVTYSFMHTYLRLFFSILCLPAYFIACQAFASCAQLPEIESVTELEKECTPEKWLEERAGWGFDLNINAGMASSNSQFRANSENSTTQDLHSTGKRSYEFIPMPFVRLDYTLENLRTQFFLGNSRENIAKGQFQLEAGLTHQFKDKTQITVAAFPELNLFGDTWADPFKVEAAREKTHEQAYGGRLSIDKIKGIPLAVKYAFAFNRIKKESSGKALGLSTEEQTLLHRNAFLQRFALELPAKLTSNTFLQVALIYTGSNAKGEANSFDDYGMRIGLFKKLDPHFFVFNTTYSQRYTDVENPVFDTTQRDSELSFFSAYSYELSVLTSSLDNCKFVMLGGYKIRDSNITFYEEKGGIISAGIAYSY